MSRPYSGQLASPPPFEHNTGMGMGMFGLLGVNQSGEARIRN